MDRPVASKKWMKLDNAAKIYPAARRRNWKSLFRLSAELSEAVDPDVLAQAQQSVLRRFPGFALKLKSGLFWYYLEHNEGAPDITPDVAYPCAPLDFKANKGFMFRFRYFRRRIAVEIFHSIADGTGGLCFLKTLVAEYLRLKYGAIIPRGDQILDCSATSSPEETEDAFDRYARVATRSRSESDAFFLKGTPEPDGYVNIITGIIPAGEILERSKARRVSLTEYLAAALILAADKLQRKACRRESELKPVKVSIPINLRNFYPTKTLRNFSSYVNPGIDPRYGEYSFDEVLSIVHHYMKIEVTEKVLNAKITKNIRTERHTALRLTPLFLKNIAMKYSFRLLGDRKYTTTLSNLGAVTLPEEMAKYVTRMDFLLGPPARNKVSAAALSYNGNLIINFTRTIKESALEREFFRFLVKQGVHVKIESNQRL